MKTFPKMSPADFYLQLQTSNSQHQLCPWLTENCVCSECRERRGQRWDAALREWR